MQLQCLTVVGMLRSCELIALPSVCYVQIQHTLLEAKFKNKTAIKKQMNATLVDNLF